MGAPEGRSKNLISSYDYAKMSLTKCSTSKAVVLLAAVFLIAEVAAMQESNPCAHNDENSMAPDENPGTLDRLILDLQKEVQANNICFSYPRPSAHNNEIETSMAPDE